MVRTDDRGIAIAQQSSKAGDQQGYLALVLHAHLPFVRHPEHDHFLEEHWFFEAVTETYLPLLRVLEQLAADGVDFRLTMSLSPTLISMLDDQLLRRRYDQHLELSRRLAASEQKRAAKDGHLSYLASHYKTRFDEVLQSWQGCDGDIVEAFASLQRQGMLDIVTCGATHGYLPLLQMYPEAVWAQLKVATQHYRRRFGQPPRGVWLPECGYYDGLDQMIAAAGLRYFVADTHGVLWADPRPRAGSFAPIFAPSGVAVFPRDVESSIEVWSRERGYPGDPVYREFYRDIGFDLPMKQVGPFLRPAGIRKDTGIKYHRITGDTEDKQLYDPYWAHEKAIEHADDFIDKRLAQIDRVGSLSRRRPPLVVAPYDAELFGHWWYEGPSWIERVFRSAANEQRAGRLVTTHLADYLKLHPCHQVARPAQSSWGERGFHEYWINGTNEWIYPLLHEATERMISLARWPAPKPVERRALQQAARELLLAQSSDWAFIMSAGTAVDYAVRRTRLHLERFSELARQLGDGSIDEQRLSEVEDADNVFPRIDYRVFAGR